MRERHHARLCRDCSAPMARQEAACWRCGTRWASEDAPSAPTLMAPPVLVAIGGGRDETDDERWTNEGGRTDPMPLRATAGRI
jgi:hypothetical protein